MSMDCDIAVIGGGPVGAALALALRDSGLNIHLLEARAAGTVADPRALALSYGSRLLLDRLEVWEKLSPITPIRTIHISQKHSFGRTVLRAAELNVPELGYILPYTALQAGLQNALQTSGTTCLLGAVVTRLHGNAERVSLTYQYAGNEHTLNARLAVVADGGKLLETAHPPALHDYGQSAIIAHVSCTRWQAATAFERFTPQGPVALLPHQNGYELVWTAASGRTQEMLQWSDEHFLAQLHQHFGDRVGQFLTVGKRACFPLRRKRASGTSLPHTALLGNAAQILHPVAGQGFNIGLRDAWELAQEILDNPLDSLGSDTMLANYHARRKFDRNAGGYFTDGLVHLFSSDLSLLNAGRGISLTLLDCLPGMKTFVAKRMMFGVNG